jgi:acyl-CoA synthetase (AMP-forming)/AMP-acid ligase II
MTRSNAWFWPELASQQRGIYFYQNTPSVARVFLDANAWCDASWCFWSYHKILSQALRAANALAASRQTKNGLVLIAAAESGPGAVVAFFGALIAGCKPAFLAPPRAMQSQCDHALVLFEQARALQAQCLVVDAALEIVLRQEMAPCVGGVALLTLESLVSGSDAEPTHVKLPEDFSYVQPTSGTTGSPKPVVVHAAALVHNLTAVRDWLGWRGDHATASWLPLHHDMGLVGCLLMSFWMQTDFYLMRPAHFLRSPLHFLQCFGLGRAQLSAMPPFALAYAMRKVARSALEGLDFGDWHALVVGSGPLSASELARFESWLMPHGLRRGVLCPAYGLAEATLAVSGSPPGKIYQSWSETIQIAGCDWADLASSGCVLKNTQVCVLNDEGQVLPDGAMGHIVVSGWGLNVGALETDGQRTLDTGDMGWFHAGELFVVGRLGDGIKLHGRWLFARDVEHSVVSCEVLLQDACMALLGTLNGRATVVLLVDQRLRHLHHVVQSFFDLWATELDSQVFWVPPRLLLRTTSGKPMRRALWQYVVSGALQAYADVGNEHAVNHANPQPQLHMEETSS